MSANRPALNPHAWPLSRHRPASEPLGPLQETGHLQPLEDRACPVQRVLPAFVQAQFGFQQRGDSRLVGVKVRGSGSRFGVRSQILSSLTWRPRKKPASASRRRRPLTPRSATDLREIRPRPRRRRQLLLDARRGLQRVAVGNAEREVGRRHPVRRIPRR